MKNYFQKKIYITSSRAVCCELGAAAVTVSDERGISIFVFSVCWKVISVIICHAVTQKMSRMRIIYLGAVLVLKGETSSLYAISEIQTE